VKPALSDIWLTDPPSPWEALGFYVRENILRLPPLIDINVGAEAVALAINGVEAETLDGVPLVASQPKRAWGVRHPNGVIGIDHFVIVTPDFDRTAAALDAAGMPFRRVRDAGGFRQGFRRFGSAILEVVEALEMPPGPARFWGLTFVASDLDRLAALLGDRLHAPKDAVQPGRRIATLDRLAGVSVPVAFMTPAPPE
jgi:hypothetical protein